MNQYDRVTSVLYPFCGLTKVDPLILQRAADRGTLIHNAAQCIIDDIPIDDIPDDYKGYIDSFNIWKEGKVFKKHPGRWNDDELLITGECDGIYEMDNELILFDLKTPAKESSTWKLQGSAYNYLAHQNGVKVDHVEFIKLNKSGKKPTVYGYGDYFDEFRMLLHVYRTYFKNKLDEVIYE